MKVTVVGAGAVGATCADNIARRELAHEVVLLDIKEGISEGEFCKLYNCNKAQRVVVKFNLKD